MSDRQFSAALQPIFKAESSPRCALRGGRFLGFIGKFTDHANAGGERFENRVSPTRWQNRRGLLVYVLVRLSEKVRELALGRRGEFSHGDDEADFAALVLFLEREMMEKSQFFRIVLLRKSPIVHKPSAAPGRPNAEIEALRTTAS